MGMEPVAVSRPQRQDNSRPCVNNSREPAAETPARLDISPACGHMIGLGVDFEGRRSLERGCFFVAITGAQGVGKSTFCRNLQDRLRRTRQGEVHLLDGLGQRIRALGIPVGSASTRDSIAAVWTAHLEREATASDGLVLLDRCVIDALAYTHSLAVNSPVETWLYEAIARINSKQLRIVIHLTLSEYFTEKLAAHETPKLRADVARAIPLILHTLGVRHLHLDAASSNAIDGAADAIHEIFAG